MDLLLRPVWVLVADAGRREQPSGTVRGPYHLYALGRRFIAERIYHVVVDSFDSYGTHRRHFFRLGGWQPDYYSAFPGESHDGIRETGERYEFEYSRGWRAVTV